MSHRIIHVLVLILFVCVAFIFTSQVCGEDKYWIKVTPTVRGPFTVDADIQTNIPGSVTLAVCLGLSGQKGSDIAIGTGFIRVPITNGRGKATIDGTKKVFPPGSQLPPGRYNVEVSFYPRWPENKDQASKLGIKNPIEGAATIKLTGSGTSVNSVKMKAEGQKWVVLNVTSGMPWDSKFWESKFGSYQELEYRGEGNPKILKMYYFKTIDTTLMVNVLKNEIVTYRIGMEYK